MIRTILILSSFMLIGRSPAAEPIPPSRVTLDESPRTLPEIAKAIEKQTGIAVDVANADPAVKAIAFSAKAEPFWSVVERLAKAGNAQIDVSPKGKIALTQIGKTPPSYISGSFRIVVKSVTLRKNFTGGSRNDVVLEFQWEPRFPVFRFDAGNSDVNASDDRGNKLTAILEKAKTAIGENSIHTTTIEIQGLTREAKKIAKLEGTIQVTASPKMLAFTFDDLTAKLPAEKELDGVKVTLAKFVPADGRWDAEFKLLYPDGHPDFESFETWLDNNKMRLLSADRTKSFAPDNFSTSVNGRRATAEYHFLAAAGKGPQIGDRKGWSLVYETPAPLVEFSVPFTLTDIELP